MLHVSDLVQRETDVNEGGKGRMEATVVDGSAKIVIVSNIGGSSTCAGYQM